MHIIGGSLARCTAPLKAGSLCLLFHAQSIKEAMDAAISAIETKLSKRMEIRTKKVRLSSSCDCFRV